MLKLQRERERERERERVHTQERRASDRELVFRDLQERRSEA